MGADGAGGIERSAAAHGIDIDRYHQGDCHLFAMALNRAFGFAMRCLWDLDPHDDGIQPLGFPVLVHAFCVRPDGSLVDARGTAEPDELENGHGDVFEPSEQEMAPGEMERMLADPNGWRAPDLGEMERLVGFLLDNAAAYRDGPAGPVPAGP